MINNQRLQRKHREEVVAGQTVEFCRCWQSATFPYCDGAHKQLNAETGDSLGPVVVTAVTDQPTSQTTSKPNNSEN